MHPDTAAALGSGDVPVLGTPRLLALAEAATVAAVAPHLAPGQTTVGTAVTLEHRRASPVGSGLVIEAELTEVDGRRLVFSFIARRDDGPGQPAGTQLPGTRLPEPSRPDRGRRPALRPAPELTGAGRGHGRAAGGRPGPVRGPRPGLSRQGTSASAGGGQTPTVERG